MRSRNGAWAAFDKDNTRALVYKLPFADFGAMLDPPSEDVTAHVIEMLRGRRVAALMTSIFRRHSHISAATQRPWGSWYGRWGVNHIYGTWCVVSALVSAARRARHGSQCRRLDARVQNPDGGWGETCHSYVDESFAGVGHEHAVADGVGDAHAATRRSR